MNIGANKLKSKAFFLGCELHRNCNGRILPKNIFHEWFENIGIETFKELNLQKTLNELTYYNFHEYASLLFILEVECFHITSDFILDRIYKAIKANSSLKYVTKIVLSYSLVNMTFSPTHWKITFNGGSKRVQFNYPTKEQISRMFPDLTAEAYKLLEEMPGAILIKVFGMSDKTYVNKYIDILRQQIKTRTPDIDNLILMECIQLGVPKGPTIYESFFEKLMAAAEINSIQELAKNTIDTCTDNTVFQEIGNYSTTCAGGCYIFNINPALALFINSLNVPANLKLAKREASKYDLKLLQEGFTSKKIPHITVGDGSTKDVKRLMAKIQRTRFINLKYLYIFVMAHGGEGDIIHTKTDSYNINEVIFAPLLANSSLEGVLKFVLINACRGKFDPRFADDDQPLSITDTSAQDEHLVKLYSTQKSCVSLIEETGAICIKEFVNVFKKPFHQLTLEEMAREMEANLLKVWSDCGFDRVTDYCVRPETEHVIKIIFENYKDHEEQLEDLRKFVDEYKEI